MPQQTAPEGPAADALEGRGPSPIATRPRALVARQNATKSTGPRTLTGKARSARNATKHGLTARAVVLPHLEDTADWGAHRGAIIAALAPVGALEAELAERVALLTWRLRRVVRVETAIIAGQLADAERDAVERARPRTDDDEELGFDDGWTETLDTLRDDAENLDVRAMRHRRIILADADTELDPAGVEALVYDVAERADPGASVEALDGVAPDWRTRRWTGREELERMLARAFGNEELVGMARVLVMLRADAARRRLEDAEKRHARHVAERQVPTVNAELLERYETHLQRQLASALTMLRDVRETFTSTG